MLLTPLLLCFVIVLAFGLPLKFIPVIALIMIGLVLFLCFRVVFSGTKH